MRVMLAGKAQPHLLKFPLLASPKLDGIRAYMPAKGANLLARSNKPIPNVGVQRKFALDLLRGMDGELIAGDAWDSNVYRRTNSVVMSRNGDTSTVRFHVFDCFPGDMSDALLTFHQRYDMLKRFMREHVGKDLDVRLVPHTLIKSEDDLLAYEQEQLETGYEGVMVRSLGGLYKEGRSTLKEGWLLKLKRFEVGEAKVDSYSELTRNDNERDASGKRTSHKAGKTRVGSLGVLHGSDVKTGAKVDVGTGFSAKERAELWAKRKKLAGKVFRYKFFPRGSKDRPRFPVFDGWRDPRDM